MQERGDTDSDENKDFIPGMVPDDMQQGPIAHAPVNMSHVARRARDELCAEACVRNHQATVHRDQQAASSAGATGGAVSRH
jgi:alkylhydroperoxidase family enzyme